MQLSGLLTTFSRGLFTSLQCSWVFISLAWSVDELSVVEWVKFPSTFIFEKLLSVLTSARASSRKVNTWIQPLERTATEGTEGEGTEGEELSSLEASVAAASFSWRFFAWNLAALSMSRVFRFDFFLGFFSRFPGSGSPEEWMHRLRMTQECGKVNERKSVHWLDHKPRLLVGPQALVEFNKSWE